MCSLYHCQFRLLAYALCVHYEYPAEIYNLETHAWKCYSSTTATGYSATWKEQRSNPTTIHHLPRWAFDTNEHEATCFTLIVQAKIPKAHTQNGKKVLDVKLIYSTQSLVQTLIPS